GEYGTENARNENLNPFQRTRLGRKVDMKGTIKNTPNKFETNEAWYYDLKGCRHVDDDQRKSLVVYGWLQVGFELSFYAMNWFGGLYRFGLLDHCILPSQEDECEFFEDIYCILKELNVKLSQTENSVKELYRSNVGGKCHGIKRENSPVFYTLYISF
ncbi:1270_t:CDS:2, partial [Rhizophagus irregularis]